MYVAHASACTIGVFASDDGTLLRTLGEGRGGGERQLKFPDGVALSADGGTLYIADVMNHRVAVWRSADGAHVRSIGCGEGIKPGQLRCPRGLALSPDGDALFVVEEGNDRVSVFDPRTGCHLSRGRRGIARGAFRGPKYCTLSRDGGVLYVSDFGNARIVACDVATGSLLRCFSGIYGRMLSLPHGLALSVCGSELYVAAHDYSAVAVLASADGSMLRSWAVAAPPIGVSLGPDGRLFVTLWRSNRLCKFS